MNLANAAKIIRFQTKNVKPESAANFVAQPDAGGRALLERDYKSLSTTNNDGVGSLSRRTRKSLLLGIDFGASQTRLLAEFPGVEQLYLNRRIPSVVAMLKSEGEKTISRFLYFGEEAEKKSDNFKFVRPWQGGEIEDPVLAREFVRHLRSFMQREDALQNRAIVAVPLMMSGEGRQDFRVALRGIFDEVIFLPRPYLTALGSKGMPLPGTVVGHPAIILDLGAGSTEVYRVGEHYPSSDEMEGVSFGGDDVDHLIAASLQKDYPAFVPDLKQIKNWKDNFGYVGSGDSPVVVKISVDGTEQSVGLSNALRRGCDVWVNRMMELLKPQLEKLSGHPAQSQNILVCGGGSQMSGLAPMLTRVLNLSGYESVHVEIAAEENSSLAAIGALEAARKVREEQWIEFRT